tara:strand:+ start:215 stop:316 length:102 start_codon:yes stop_codon:yes gene_type:complete
MGCNCSKDKDKQKGSILRKVAKVFTTKSKGDKK